MEFGCPLLTPVHRLVISQDVGQDVDGGRNLTARCKELGTKELIDSLGSCRGSMGNVSLKIPNKPPKWVAPKTLAKERSLALRV